MCKWQKNTKIQNKIQKLQILFAKYKYYSYLCTIFEKYHVELNINNHVRRTET